tara:strand:- start:291 stop:458 length:168 start_codon:yes stop_codon:yes gene_type:complete
MNLEEYKIFAQLAEVFKKASKLGNLKRTLIDQRELKLHGDSINYEWTLVVKKRKN